MALSPKHPLRRGLERLVSRGAMGLAAASARALPLRWLRAIGNLAGHLVFVLSSRRRRLADTNLIAAFGDTLSAPERRRIILRASQNITKLFLELLKAPTLGANTIRDLVTLRGEEKIRAALECGKGVVLVTAHFGNWELGGARLAADGLDVGVVARDASDSGVASTINRCRERLGMQVLDRYATRKMLAHLRRNGCLCILPDQHAKRDALRLTFLGRPAWTAKGPVTLAVRTGCAVIPVFCPRQSDDTIGAYVLDEVPIDRTLDREAAIAETAQRINDVLGAEIRKDPAQWLWLHDRWKDTQRGRENPPAES